jgi:hypothetical protein
MQPQWRSAGTVIATASLLIWGLIGVPETGSVTMDAWKSLQPKGLLSTGKEIFQGEREGEGTTLLLGYPEEPISQTNKSTQRLLQLANVSNNTLVYVPAPSGWADGGAKSLGVSALQAQLAPGLRILVPLRLDF